MGRDIGRPVRRVFTPWACWSGRMMPRRLMKMVRREEVKREGSSRPRTRLARVLPVRRALGGLYGTVIVCLALSACSSGSTRTTPTTVAPLATPSPLVITAGPVPQSDGPAVCATLGGSEPLRKLASALGLIIDPDQAGAARQVVADAVRDLRSISGHSDLADSINTVATAISPIANATTPTDTQVQVAASALEVFGKQVQDVCHFPLG